MDKEEEKVSCMLVLDMTVSFHQLFQKIQQLLYTFKVYY